MNYKGPKSETLSYVLFPLSNPLTPNIMKTNALLRRSLLRLPAILAVILVLLLHVEVVSPGADTCQAQPFSEPACCYKAKIVQELLNCQPEAALDTLYAFARQKADEQHIDLAINLKSEYLGMKKRYCKGRLNKEEALIERSKIIYRMLQLTEKIHQYHQSSPWRRFQKWVTGASSIDYKYSFVLSKYGRSDRQLPPYFGCYCSLPACN